MKPRHAIVLDCEGNAYRSPAFCKIKHRRESQSADEPAQPQRSMSVITIEGEDFEALEIVTLDVESKDELPRQQETNYAEVIFVEQIVSTRNSNSRKRKAREDSSANCFETENCEDVKILDTKDDDVVFVEAKKRSRLFCEEVEILDVESSQLGNTTNQEIATLPINQKPNRRCFQSAQEAASSLVKWLLRLGEERVRSEQMGSIDDWEYNLLLRIQHSWRMEKLQQEQDEPDQEFFWRVRRFTRKAFITLSRQMSHDSALAWSIVTNNREHTIKFLNERQSQQLPQPPPQVKQIKEENGESIRKMKTENNETDSKETALLTVPKELLSESLVNKKEQEEY